MNSILIGEVRTAEHALRGLLRAGHPPSAIYTTDFSTAMKSSGMERSYYCDLIELGQEEGIPCEVVSSDLRLIVDELEQQNPDYLWIMGWPYIVRDPVLELAPCIGMHPTPLPKRRGGAPMNWTILDGEDTGAVSLFRLRSGIDNGEILMQEGFSIRDGDYVGDVAERIYAITEDLVAEASKSLDEGVETWTTQDESQATYTRRRKPADGRIAWNDSCTRVRNLVRATSHPFPGAFTELDGRRVKIWRADPVVGFRAPLKASPGTILEFAEEGMLVSTADNAVCVAEAQFEEDSPVSVKELESLFAPYVGRQLL